MNRNLMRYMYIIILNTCTSMGYEYCKRYSELWKTCIYTNIYRYLVFQQYVSVYYKNCWNFCFLVQLLSISVNRNCATIIELLNVFLTQQICRKWVSLHKYLHLLSNQSSSVSNHILELCGKIGCTLSAFCVLFFSVCFPMFSSILS